MKFYSLVKEILKDIKDCRHPSYVKHKLKDILWMIILGILSGNGSLGDIHAYMVDKQDMMKNSFGIEQIPSKSTLSRILKKADFKEVSDATIKIMRLLKTAPAEYLAADGKAIRSTIEEGSTQAKIQRLTLLDPETRCVIAEKDIEEKTNEIPILRMIIEAMKLEGITITGDALHCQYETCETIIRQGGNYLFGLKGNQEELLDAVQLYFKDPETAQEWEIYSTETELGHGRIEKRVCYKSSNTEWIKEMRVWPGLKTVFVIKTQVERKGQVTEKTNYFITSLDKSAKELLNIKRRHWHIESTHWIMDVVLNEDSCQLKSKNAHLILNSMRKLGIFVHDMSLKQTKNPSSIRRNMQKFGRNDDHLIQTLGQLM